MRTAFTLIATLLLSTFSQPLPAASESDDEAPEVTPIREDRAPLRDWFNESKGTPRFIALLSPT